MENFKKLTLLCVLLIVLTSCNTGTRRFVYPVDKSNLVKFSQKERGEKCIAVSPFIDRRGEKTINIVRPSAAIVLPLLPFIQRSSDRPENNSVKFKAVKFKHFRISDDITDAVIASIKNSNLVSETVNKPSDKYDSADYVLYGQINELSYRSRFMLYGTTCVGAVIFGALGLPIYTHHGEIDIDLFLYDRSTRKVIWKYKIVEDGGKLQGFYYNVGRSIITPNPKMGKEYGEMLQEGMNRAIFDMKEKVF